MAYPRQRLMASGSSLAVDSGYGHVALLQGFSIEGFETTIDHNEYWSLGSPRAIQVPTRKRVELSIVSHGAVHFLGAREADHLFFDPVNASIDELLELAYRKMDARSQRENLS